MNIGQALIKKQLEGFQGDLRKYECPELVHRYITFGQSFAMGRDQYISLKGEVARHFRVHPVEVVMVGSAKLGFSIKETRRYQPFCDTSDVDVAIISPNLFDSVWQSLFDFENNGGYWPAAQSFKVYLFSGWVRPDLLPPDKSFAFAGDWWEFFRTLSSSGRYGNIKLRAGLYRTWHYLESYQSICIQECKKTLGASKK